MPEEKKDRQFRLAEGDQRRLAHLAQQWEMSDAQVVAIAIKHTYGSFLRDEGMHLNDAPPAAPKDPQADSSNRPRGA